MRMDKPAIRLLIVDDHRLVRDALQSLMEEEDIQVVGTAEDGCEGVALAEQLQPDVVLMDFIMPCMDGAEATRLLTARFPRMRILMLTSFIQHEYVFSALKAGASGYWLKSATRSELIDGIRKVYRGEFSLHPNNSSMVLAEISHPAQNDRPTLDSLTEREVEVLRLVVQGLSNKDIAEQLAISLETARRHVSRILMKLHVANRAQAASYALRMGISDLDDSA